MEDHFLEYYDRELKHLREMSGEFAKAFPKIAGRLGLSTQECQDPYVERLLEGFAFLTARVQLKLDAEFPRFTQYLLDTVFPHYLVPTPAMVVTEMEPDHQEGSLAQGPVIERGSVLRSMLGKNEQTRTEFTTAHDVRLWPLEIAEVRYVTGQEIDAFKPPEGPKIRAALRIRMRLVGNNVFKKLEGFDSLTFHITGEDSTPVDLYEQIFAHTEWVDVRSTSKPKKKNVRRLPPLDPMKVLRREGYDPEQALLPVHARSFEGYRLLQEYFALPERFLFFSVGGLERVADYTESEFDIFLFFRQAVKTRSPLESVIDASSLRLFCTPAINLFPKRADRIHITEKFSEHHVVPDKTKPLDYEVFDVREVTGIGARPEDERIFRPFYQANDFDSASAGDDTGTAYFATHRRPRQISDRERRRGQRSRKYAGSEVFVSIVDAANRPYDAELKQLAVETLCTNRDLPLHFATGQGPTDFRLDEGAVRCIRCLRAPTDPRPSPAEGEIAWRLISHLALNYMSIIDNSRGGAAAMRDILKLYANPKDSDHERQIEGVTSIKHREIIERVLRSGPISFGRGLEITVELDEDNFAGTGAFLLGAILDQFFAKYVSINSFAKTVVRSQQRGVLMSWPAHPGRRHVI